MSEKLRLVSGGQKPPAEVADKNQVEKKRRQLRSIRNAWHNQTIRSYGPRGGLAILIGGLATVLVWFVSFLLRDFLGFTPGEGVVLIVSVVAFVAVRYVANKRITLPRTFAEHFENQLSAYDPVDVSAYRAFQHQARTRGFLDDDIHYWLSQEFHALDKLSGPIKPSKRFIDRKL